MQSDFFDSFICNRTDCLAKISENSFLLNCFHSICCSHAESAGDVFCSDQLCATMRTEYPNFISLPPKKKRCQNIVNNHVADHMVCLFNAKKRGAKCGTCDTDTGALEFCTDCPSIWCGDHRAGIHPRLGPKHQTHTFVQMTLEPEEILKASLGRRKDRIPKEFREHIDDLIMNKESIDFSLLNLENSFELVLKEKQRLLEEAEISFTQIRRHIEQMREELLEQLNSKTDNYLNILEQKRTLLQFQSAAASRAINLANLIDNTRIKVPDKLVEMFSSNTLAFVRHLYEVPPPPIEHVNIPKIIRNTLGKLEDIHPIDTGKLEHTYSSSLESETGSNPQFYYFFGCTHIRHPTDRPVTPSDLSTNEPMYVLVINEIDFNWKDTTIEAFFLDNPKKIPKRNIMPLVKGDANYCEKQGGKQIDINIKFLRERKKLYQVALQFVTYKKNEKTPRIVLTFPQEPVNISPFSVTPGDLSGLTCANQKLFAINKSGKEILVFNASQEIISQQMDREEPVPFPLVGKFGSNNLSEPHSIAAVRSLTFVSDCTLHCLVCFAEDGSFIRIFGRLGKHAGEFNKPMGVYGDQENGRLVVADSGNKRVQVFQLSKQTWTIFEIEDTTEYKPVPIDVKLDTMGNFFILTESNAIIKFNKDFRFPVSVLHSDTITPVMPFFAISRSDVIYLCSKTGGSVYTIRQSASDKYNFNRCNFIPKNLRPAGETFDEHNRLYISHNEVVDAANPTSSRVYVVTQRCENDSL